MNLPTLIALLTTLTLHLTTTTTATPLSTRNVPGILKEFALTGGNLILLDKAVKLYEPKKEDQGLERKQTNVEVSLIKSMNAVHATPPFKKQESSLVSNVACKMQPVWVEYLHDVVVKKHEFEKAKIADRIQEHIRDLKERCHNLAVSIEEKLKPEDRETIVDRERQLDREFDRAIAAFD
ncbi:hypothetical protein BDV35DRAFT_392021 [Aspergillus flavus]|uniref:Cell wall galactomannoprotein n=2 Tax=Aspergillus subgen. Circumdati TaxID=2720871 RepID=A0A1S9E162_ASPOZ|nr:hypothetical protein BDV35DRAFT_392021 [Aspergillus flavus]OOO15079.1 Cell wall galactomannoprotein [Aspergillus oryzae]